MAVEADIKTATGDSPATHKMGGRSGGWRKGTTGYAELNPGFGKANVRQEWLVTGWCNADLDHQPFVSIA